MQKAIDCWINVDMGDQADVEYLKRVKEDYLNVEELGEVKQASA